MKLLEINEVNFGSTGNIMLQIRDVAGREGLDAWVSYAKSRSNLKKDVSKKILIGNKFERNISWFFGKITGYNGCFNYLSTYLFIKRIKRMNFDIIHLHNLHNTYINLSMLFKYIKKNNVKIVWTFHDCWPFTGRCPHFDFIECEKWKNGCFKCKFAKNEYPQTNIDKSEKMWKLKKRWFSNVNDLTIVTPSLWLANLVRESFLNSYNISVINNGINLDIFKPTKSDFRVKYKIENKFILLGVAFDWGKRKGLDIFIRLANILDSRFQIVMVVTDEIIDKLLPNNIISIHKTPNQVELAKIYSSCDLFVNPTREETFGMVNIESLACGTPVLTFDTGGCPECVDDKTGRVIRKDDFEGMLKNIFDIYLNRPFNSSDCLIRSKLFNNYDMCKKYLNIFKNK